MKAILSLPLNIHVQLSSGARSLMFGLSFHIFLCFVYVSSEGPGQNV